MSKRRKKTRLRPSVVIFTFLLLLVLLVICFVLFFNDKKDNNTNVNNNVSNNTSNNESNNDNNEEPTIPSNNEEPEDNTNKTSKGFKIEVINGVTYVDGVLIANKTYELPEAYTSTTNNTKNVSDETQNAFDHLQAAALLEGYHLVLQSGYRSYSTQNTLYNNYVNRDGKVAADTYSARPGHSEHQTGLAFDVCDSNVSACINSDFNSTPQAKWLSENAYKYGLILRYPESKTDETGYKYESWHFRYVGVELATKLYNNGDWITLEDYYGITSEYE